MKDKCVMCNEETLYDETHHIDYRYGYVEGMGQLCINCYNETPRVTNLVIPVSLIKDTPNDMELGEKVRSLYHKYQK